MKKQKEKAKEQVENEKKDIQSFKDILDNIREKKGQRRKEVATII